MIKPAFTEKNIPVIFASNDNYALYLGVAVKSLLENASPEFNYDLMVMEGCISETKKFLLKKMAADYPNCSLRFVPVADYVEIPGLHLNKYFSIETYYRLFIPTLFGAFDRLIYLDCDLAVLEDISKLYQTDISGCTIGATRNISTIHLYLNEYIWENINWKKYYEETLQLEKPVNYFQAGVMLIDVKRMKAGNNQERLLDLANSFNPFFVDQDILNSFFSAEVKIIDQSWDYENGSDDVDFGFLKNWPSYQLYEAVLAARENPKIIHYAGSRKVWADPRVSRGEIWWSYARKTPFYENILYRTLGFAA